MAFQKYEQIVHLAQGHALKDPALVLTVEDARIQKPLLLQEMEKDEEAALNSKKGRNAQEVKARGESYAKYESNTERVLDAMSRAQMDGNGNNDLPRYKDDVKDALVRYNQWYDAISGEESGYTSAKMLKVSIDGLTTAESWWQILVDKKMPDALYADIMRRNQLALVDSATSRVKAAVAVKDFLEDKNCGPCDGTGRLKCPVCRGTGICEYCKGKGNPEIKCCMNGVCDACKGRKESDCIICKGTGRYPPSLVKKAP